MLQLTIAGLSGNRARGLLSKQEREVVKRTGNIIPGLQAAAEKPGLGCGGRNYVAPEKEPG